MENWDNINEDSIEDFIKANKDKFSLYRPSIKHDDHFLMKLHKKFTKIISIIPHLVKVAIATIIVFTISICLWNSYIRWDRKYISLPQKIENTYHRIFSQK